MRTTTKKRLLPQTACLLADSDSSLAKCTSSTMGGHANTFVNLMSSRNNVPVISCGKIVRHPDKDSEYQFYKWLVNSVHDPACAVRDALISCSCQLQRTMRSSSTSSNPSLCTSNAQNYMQLESLYSGLQFDEEIVFLDYKIGRHTATRADKNWSDRFRHRIIDSESTSRDLHYRLETFDIRNNPKARSIIDEVSPSALLLHRRRGAFLDLKTSKRRKLHVLFNLHPFYVLDELCLGTARAVDLKLAGQLLTQLHKMKHDFIDPNFARATGSMETRDPNDTRPASRYAFGFMGSSIFVVRGVDEKTKQPVVKFKLGDFGHPYVWDCFVQREVNINNKSELLDRHKFFQIIHNYTQGLLSLISTVEKWTAFRTTEKNLSIIPAEIKVCGDQASYWHKVDILRPERHSARTVSSRTTSPRRRSRGDIPPERTGIGRSSSRGRRSSVGRRSSIGRGSRKSSRGNRKSSRGSRKSSRGSRKSSRGSSKSSNNRA
jgi:hypothetical protein